MFLSFILFVLIGFIPFVSVFFALDINIQMSKKILPQAILMFMFASIAKLIAVAVVLPEVQGHNVQTFLVTLVIHSLEFVAFRQAVVRCRIGNTEKGSVLAFWWACLSVFATNIFAFISNSRTEELEVHHIVFAISAIAALFVYFAVRNVALSIRAQQKVTALDGRTQLFVLLSGLPAALASIDVGQVVPLFVPDLLKLVAAAALWAASGALTPAEKPART
jgi:hypothetical protein